MHNKRNNTLHMAGWIFYWFVLVTSFLTIGFILTSQAMGYRYNSHISAYQKTGMIVIDNPPKDSQFIIDGESHLLRSTVRLPNILPGIYRVRIEKPGYIPWEKRLELKPGYVVHVADISLFRKNPVFDENIDRYEALLPYYQNEKSAARIDGDELWIGSKFVTRFSVEPGNALLLPNQKYILYTLGNEIRVINESGEQDSLLYTRSSGEPSPFVYIDNALVFQDGYKLRAMLIPPSH